MMNANLNSTVDIRKLSLDEQLNVTGGTHSYHSLPKRLRAGNDISILDISAPKRLHAGNDKSIYEGTSRSRCCGNRCQRRKRRQLKS